MGRLSIQPKVDMDGCTIFVGEDGLIRIDGIVLAKLVSLPDGTVYIQVYDRDRLRSVCRGTRTVEIPLDVLVDELQEAAQAQK